MTEAIVVQQSEEMSIEQLQSQVVKVQQVMKAVMKVGIGFVDMSMNTIQTTFHW